MKSENIGKRSKAMLIREVSKIESAARYIDLYEHAPVGYCTLDRKGRILEINLTGASLLGTPREELINRPFRAALTRSSFVTFRSHLKRCYEEKARVSSDLSLTNGQGTPRIIRIITEPVLNDDKPPAQYRTVLIDVTEETRFGNELRVLSDLGAVLVSPQDYSEALDAASRMIVPALADLLKIDLRVTDDRMERSLVLFADPAKQKALGEKLKEFYPRSGSKTYQARVIASGKSILLPRITEAARVRMAHDEAHASLQKAAGVISMMVVPLTVRGKTFGAMTFCTAESGRHYTASDVRIAETIASRIAATVDNVRLSEERKKAISARDAILAVVSHDLRNSLNVIQLKTYVMAQSETEQTRADGAFIQRRADEMRRLIQDLLDISSLEAGQLRLEKSPNPVIPIVTRACEGFELQAAQKSIKFETDLPAGEQLHIECDPDRIQQVLINIIGNAIKFTGEGGAILVRVAQHVHEVWFSVTDSGSGIPDADLPHVFDRFWTVSKSGRRGTGLGLSIARGLIEAHSGRIWAESKVGAGSTFFFAIPLLTFEGEPLDTAQTARRTREVVLIVDDDRGSREALQNMLEKRGYRVIMSSNGAEALDYLHHGARPSCILLELLMPVMDGWAFLKERNRDPDLKSVPVIVFSGDPKIENQIAAEHAIYLQKPMSRERLLESVDRALATSRSR